MSKSIQNPAKNEVSITGTLHSVVIRDGIAKGSGKPYRSGTVTLRVNQHYGANGGVDEISEIPVSFVAMKFKRDGSQNPAYDNLKEFMEGGSYHSIQEVGLEHATRLRVSGKYGNLSENMFVGRDGETINSGWRVNSSFFGVVRGGGEASPSNGDSATFSTDIFIMSIDDEVTAEGEATGRLHIRGAIVRYGQRLDVMDFYAENPGVVDFMSRNYNVNDTVNVVGRIRYTSTVEETHEESSWGEVIPKSTTRTKRELILVNGADEVFDDEMAYDPADIATLNADRNSRREQLKIDARNKAAASKAAKAPVDNGGYDWE